MDHLQIKFPKRTRRRMFLNSPLVLYSLSTLLFISQNSVLCENDPSKSICSFLKMNYSYDFAFNHIVKDGSKKIYNHLLYSQQKFLKVYFDSNSKLKVIPFEYQKQEKFIGSEEDKIETNILQPDYGFSLHSLDPYTATLCFGKIHHKSLTCIEVEYHRSLTAYMKNKSNYPFELPSDFRPTLAFQHISFERYSNSWFMVLFMEQTLRMVPVVNIDTKGPTRNQSMNQPTILRRHFDRRFQSYVFPKMDKITNITYSTVIPDFLHEIPDELEITGIFSWIRRKTDKEETMIIGFNGSHHLYCLNENCSKIDGYQVFMNECRPPMEIIETINKLEMAGQPNTWGKRGLFVTKCCGQWEALGQGDTDNDDGSQWQLRNGKLYRVRSSWSTNLNYVIWSLLILSALFLLLLICWCYSCYSEANYDKKVMLTIANGHQQNNNMKNQLPLKEKAQTNENETTLESKTPDERTKMINEPEVVTN